MSHRAASLLAISLASASACGGDRGGPIPLDELAARFAAAACARTFQCCDATERSFASEEECRAAYTELMQDSIDDLRPALAAGRLGYDGDVAAACLGVIDAAACTGADDDLEAACRFFVGRVALGGACEDKDECAGGNFCDQGACVAPPGTGDECVGEACGDGAYCHTRAPTDPPGPLYTCRALEADGAPCEGRHQCASDYCDFDAGVCGPEPATTRCDGV